MRTGPLDAILAARQHRPRRYRGVLVALASLLVVPPVMAVGGLTGFHRFGGADFKAYYLAGARLRAGYPLYEPGHLPEPPGVAALKFLYPPPFALPFVPLSSLPVGPAQTLWVAASLAVLCAGVVALLRALDVPLSRAETLLLCWVALGFQGVVFVARIGNAVGALTGLLCLAGAAMLDDRPRPYLAGALTALAVAPKPYLAPAAAPLLGDRRRLVGAGAAIVALAGVSLALFAPETNAAYLDVLAAGKGWGSDRAVWDLPYHYRPLYRFPGVAGVVQAGLVLGAAGTAWVARASADDATLFAFGCVVVPLAVPTATDLTLTVALPGLLVAGVTEWRRDGRVALVAAALVAVQTSVYTVRVFVRYGPTYAPDLLAWESVGLAILWVQPATLGLAAVAGLLGWRLWTADLAGGDALAPA